VLDAYSVSGELLPAPFACQPGSARPRLQVERVLLDVLDDVFLLHLPLETAERALDRLAILDFDFSHAYNTPLRGS
jgi:hypothetical protein